MYTSWTPPTSVRSSDVRRQWAERSGEYSPAYYAHYGPDDTSETIRDILDRYLGRSASVLEVGCSSGRHLAHLLDHGFEQVSGIELNDEAFEVMAEAYPDLASTGTFYADAVENVVEEFGDGQFDAVYSVETLQHLHPDATWVFEELVRITDDLLLTVENEGRDGRTSDDRVRHVGDGIPLYHRDWRRVFTDLGLQEVEADASGRDTTRIFR